ncbi:hypothetical protein O3P69_017133 [Scylla paramamosain]|uniref:Uncharacterized protein n=1 Tax=Scylla paramamosain TaxID=85552 RepID=A0AAW0TVW2_SCYPA
MHSGCERSDTPTIYQAPPPNSTWVCCQEWSYMKINIIKSHIQQTARSPALSATSLGRQRRADGLEMLRSGLASLVAAAVSQG